MSGIISDGHRLLNNMSCNICIYLLTVQCDNKWQLWQESELPQRNLIMELFIFRFGGVWWIDLFSVAAPRAIDFLAIEHLEIYWRDPICLSFSVVVCACGKNIGNL